LKIKTRRGSRYLILIGQENLCPMMFLNIAKKKKFNNWMWLTQLTKWILNEWKHHTILDRAHNMATQSQLPIYRWMKVMNVTNYLVSKNPSKTIEKMAPKHVYTNHIFDRLVNCKSLVVWLICMYPRKEKRN